MRSQRHIDFMISLTEENGLDWHKTHQEEVTVDLELTNDTCNEVEVESSEDEVYNDDSCESHKNTHRLMLKEELRGHQDGWMIRRERFIF